MARYSKVNHAWSFSKKNKVNIQKKYSSHRLTVEKCRIKTYKTSVFAANNNNNNIYGDRINDDYIDGEKHKQIEDNENY